MNKFETGIAVEGIRLAPRYLELGPGADVLHDEVGSFLGQALRGLVSSATGTVRVHDGDVAPPLACHLGHEDLVLAERALLNLETDAAVAARSKTNVVRHNLNVPPALSVGASKERVKGIARLQDTLSLAGVGDGAPVVAVVGAAADDVALGTGSRNDIRNLLAGGALRENGAGAHGAAVHEGSLHEHSLALGRVHRLILDTNQRTVAESERVDDQVDGADLRKVVSLIEGRETSADDGDTTLAKLLGKVLQVVRSVQDVRLKFGAKGEATRERRVGRALLDGALRSVYFWYEAGRR